MLAPVVLPTGDGVKELRCGRIDTASGRYTGEELTDMLRNVTGLPSQSPGSTLEKAQRLHAVIMLRAHERG